MKKLFGLGLVFWCCAALSAQAQYYYQDVYNTGLINKDHAKYIRSGVRKVNIISYDVYQSINKDFTCTKSLDHAGRRVVTKTGSPATGNSTLVSTFDSQGRIVLSTDSTSSSVSRTSYYYDSTDASRLDSLIFSSAAIKDKDTFRYNEAHLYQYNADGVLQAMIRKKNGQPYSHITFVSDSLGRIIKESEKGKQVSPPPVYYKYDARGRLTDIFHYNATTQKMEPDFLFDYDRQGRLLEKTTVVINTRDYLLWKYSYNEKGLVSKEVVYGKKHALQGSLEYEYSY